MHNTLLQFLQKRNIVVRIKKIPHPMLTDKCANAYTNIYGTCIQYILKVNGRRLHVSNL